MKSFLKTFLISSGISLIFVLFGQVAGFFWFTYPIGWLWFQIIFNFPRQVGATPLPELFGFVVIWIAISIVISPIIYLMRRLISWSNGPNL